MQILMIILIVYILLFERVEPSMVYYVGVLVVLNVSRGGAGDGCFT